MSTRFDFLSPWRPWWRVWTAPGLAAWALACAVAQLAARLPFARLPLIPYAVPFDPSVAFVPFWIIAFGPAGLAGCIAAQIAGDLVDGLPAAALACRAIGLFIGGTWLMQLARAWLPTRAGEPWQAPGGLRVLVAGLPVALTQATWSGAGLEWAGWYPMVYTGPLQAIHHTLLIALLGAPLAPLALRLLEGRFGSWMETVPLPPAWTPGNRGRTACFLAGLALAILAVTGISWFKYGLGLLQPAVLGVHGGKPVPAAATLLLALQALALLWPDRHPVGTTAAAEPPDPTAGWRAGHFTGGGLIRR